MIHDHKDLFGESSLQQKAFKIFLRNRSCCTAVGFFSVELAVSLNWRILIFWVMGSSLMIVSFRLISTCLVVQYVLAYQPNYLSLAQNENPDNFMKLANPNGGWSHTAPIMGIPPSRPRQFRNPEIVSYFAMKKEQEANDKTADAIKTWITKEVIFDILYSMSQNT